MSAQLHGNFILKAIQDTPNPADTMLFKYRVIPMDEKEFHIRIHLLAIENL